jgi:hypothetical protein
MVDPALPGKTRFLGLSRVTPDNSSPLRWPNLYQPNAIYFSDPNSNPLNKSCHLPLTSAPGFQTIAQ